jgi:hypothetical protein
MKRILLGFFLAINIVVLVFSLGDDEIRELLMAEGIDDIQYLSKINLGIPGGDNWIVNRGRYTYIYIIDSDKNVKYFTTKSFALLSEIKYLDPDLRANVDLEYSITQHFPGMRIGNNAAKFGDYNGDGKDEILNFEDSFSFRCVIWGYNSKKGEIVTYLISRCTLASHNGPPPAGVYNHLGTDGIVIYVWDYPQERYVWDFYVWHEANQKYAHMAEIGDKDIDYSMFTLFHEPELREFQYASELGAMENSQNANESVNERPIVDTTESEHSERIELPTANNSGKIGPFIIILNVGIVAVAVVIVILTVLKTRKK